MAYKPVGVDENSDFPTRVRNRLNNLYAAASIITRVADVEQDVASKADVGHTHDTAAVTTGQFVLDRMPAGSIFTIKWNASNSTWTYNGVTVTTRPSARTNLRMMAIGTAPAAPPFAIADDFWLSEA